ncbi:hypothetical protein [Polynucleobacter sphagniphilus]|uniref:hypothetical protein n=1 Tax=Polynucleobacter sphagniphilus TaxID=1743169 RepID=UPI002476F525|nr:hypothetical protein [Polynucleobacter sphagniphilus]
MRQIGKRLFLGGALMFILGSAYADNASVSVKTCDPYQDYSCLDSALGTGFWNRLTNYYKLEMGKDAAPVDPNAPPHSARRFSSRSHDYATNAFHRMALWWHHVTWRFSP